MKKITTLMVMLVCCICSALAQTVASTPTAPEHIQDGYYMLLVKSDKTNAIGNYAYTENGKVMYDVKESENNFLGKSLNVDDFKYLFYVQKNTEGKLSFHAWNADNSWWTAYGEASYASSWTIGYKNKLYPWQKDPFGLSDKDNCASFECVDANDFGSYLKTIGSKWEGGRKGQAVPADIYVTCNNGQQFGYWDNDKNAPNNAQFKFYAVSDVPSASEIVKVNYNLTFDGSSKKTVNNIVAILGRPFPEVEVPDYIATALPTGNVKAEDNGQTFDVVCTFSDELPFTVSKEGDYHYYYLDNAKGVRLFNNGGLNYRTAAQAEKINDIKNDLWYVTGNPFDGYYIHSVSGNGAKVQSYMLMSQSTYLSMSDMGGTDKWYIFKNGDAFSVCPAVGVSRLGGKVTVDNQKNYSWRMDDNGNGIGFKDFVADNDAFRFQLTPATFTYTMYDGGDGRNYNTFSAPFDVKLAESEKDVKMYKGVVDYDAKEFQMHEILAAPAEAGIFLMGNNANETVTLEVTSGVEALEGNELYGSTTDVMDLGDKLILGPAMTTGEIGFFAAADGVTTLYANHAYLLRKTLSTVEGLSLSFGGKPTGMGHVSTSDVKNAPIYDLTGRRVNHTVKGQLYIQGGRKFIAR